MNIFTKNKIERISQDEFNSIDEVIMRFAFELHNDMGRFYNEKIYHKELSFVAEKAGFSVQNEVEIAVRHKTFLKKYYIDMLVNNSCIYELKAVEKLMGIHQKQLINYLLLTNIAHSKLINFRPPSVEYRFVSTSLNVKERKNYAINTTHLENNDKNSTLIVDIICELLGSWGAFLDLDLYHDAVVHFLGGEEKVIVSVDILRNNRVIGQERMYKFDENRAFHFSALIKNLKSYETSIRRILNHTKLDSIQWINFNKGNIMFKTVK
jgi:GxxExxY protein